MIALVLLWLSYVHGWVPLWVAICLTLLAVLTITWEEDSRYGTRR